MAESEPFTPPDYIALPDLIDTYVSRNYWRRLKGYPDPTFAIDRPEDLIPADVGGRRGAMPVFDPGGGGWSMIPPGDEGDVFTGSFTPETGVPPVGGSGTGRLLIAVATNVHRRNTGDTWETIAHGIGGTPLSEFLTIHNKVSDVFFASNNDFGISANDGDTWASRTAPASGNGIQVDRAFSGRMWVYNNDDAKIYYSDDEGQNYTVSSPSAINVATAWSFSVHPTDSNRICLSYEDGTSGDMVLEVTTNGGTTWASQVISSTALRAYTVWLPNNRLVSLLHFDALDEVHRTFSDDDGASWAATSLLYDHGAGAGFTAIDDVRTTADGYVFAIINGSSTGALRNLRSADGDTFDVMATHLSTRAHALAYDETEGDLYLSYQTDRVFYVPGAQIIASGSWVTGATELTGVPVGAVPVSATLKSNMVVLA